MNDYILLIAIIIILILLVYPVYKYLKKPKESFKPEDVGRAIKKVEKMFKDIERMGRDIGTQVKKVKNLGKDIAKLGPKIKKIARYPVELGNKIKDEAERVANEAGDFIEGEFDRIKKEVEDAANEVANWAEETWNEIENEINKIVDEIEDIPNKVKNLATDIFEDWLPKLLNKGWEEFKKHVIDPILDFFDDVGDVFNKIGDVFMEIIETITNLPKCIPIYAFDTAYEIALASLKTILPTWLKDIIRTINRYFIQPILVPFFKFCFNAFIMILEFFGFNFNFGDIDETRKQCYDFGPLDEVFEAFKEFFEMVFNAVKEIFNFIPFDEILAELLKLLGIGGGAGKRAMNEAQKKRDEMIKGIKDKAGKAAEFATDTLGNVTDTVTDTLGNVMDTTTSTLSSFGLPGIPTPGSTQLTPSFLKDANLLRSLNIPFVNNILNDIIKFPSLESFNILKMLKNIFFNKQGKFLGVSNPVAMSKEDKARKRLGEIKRELDAMKNKIKKSRKPPSKAEERKMKELAKEYNQVAMSLLTPKEREQLKQKMRERQKKTRNKLRGIMFR